MLPKQIDYILNFFDVFGYFTGSSSLAKYRKTQLLAFAVQISLAALSTLYQFQFAIELYELTGSLRTINEMLQYTIGLCTYWSIIFDSFLYRQKHKHFWNIFKKIDNFFCKQHICVRRYLCEILGYFLVSTILYVLAYISCGLPHIDGIFIYAGLIMICHLRAFYYVFCSEIVNWQLQMIERELIILKEHSMNLVGVAATNSILHTHEAINLFDQKRFKWINKYYGCIVEMTELLNTIFGWSQVSSILFGFYSLLTDINYCYAYIDSFPSLGYLSK